MDETLALSSSASMQVGLSFQAPLHPLLQPVGWWHSPFTQLIPSLFLFSGLILTMLLIFIWDTNPANHEETCLCFEISGLRQSLVFVHLLILFEKICYATDIYLYILYLITILWAHMKCEEAYSHLLEVLFSPTCITLWPLLSESGL